MGGVAAEAGWVKLAPRLAVLLLLVVALPVLGWVVSRFPGPDPATRIALAYVLALVFGALVGATELSGRYRDSPMSAIASVPAQLYMGVNALASLAMVWVLYTGRLRLGFSVFAGHPLLDALVIGGFSAMALFRSAVFTVRVRDTNVAVGPAAVLQEILRTTDRETDRRRAEPRAAGVRRIMEGVTFFRAKERLPVLCLALMQNIDPAERENLNQAVTGLEALKIADGGKSYALGLLLMNLVGEDVLTRAVESLGESIRGPIPDDPPLLDKARGLDAGQLGSLLRLCVALVPDAAERARVARSLPGKVFDLAALVEVPSGAGGNDFVVAVLRLRAVFGQDVLVEAFRVLDRSGTVVGGKLDVSAFKL